jgi:glycosyltransferase involved in cell wall biosynthesis
LNETPKISIVVPIRNEEKYIVTTIKYILTQDYPDEKLEIIIAAGESDDHTDEIIDDLAAKDSRIRVIHNPRGFSSAGRNIGAKSASGEIITFIDGHTYIDDRMLLRNIVEFMTEKDVSVLSRPQFLDTPENSFFQEAVSLARKSPIGHGLDSTIYTKEDKYVNPTSSGATYKKEVFNKVGGFDERFDACEDVDFNYRVAQSGYKSFTSMRLAVFYYPRESLGGLFRQMKRYGVGRFRLACKHPPTLSIGTLVPPLITAGLPFLAVLSFFVNILLYPFLLIAGLYVTGIFGSSLAVSLRNGIRFFPILPPIYFVIHLGMGWGFLMEMGRTLIGKGIKFS